MQKLSLENNPQGRRLSRLMSDLSEDYWCAGWLSDTEYALWADLSGTTVCGNSGWEISSYEREELQAAQGLANGWIVWSEELKGPAFVSTDDWRAHVFQKDAQANSLS